MHRSPPGLESGAQAAAAGGPRVAPPGTRAFPPEFPSGSSDSRGKLNILGQGEASCQVPTLHGVLPPPSPSPPPPPPPTPQPSPPPPAAQIPAQSQRPRRCGCCCCCCRRPRTRPLQPPFGPISTGEESGFSTQNATGELGTRRRDRLIPAPRSSRQGRRGGDEGGRQGGRLGKESGKTPLPREALLQQLLLPASLLLGELPRAPTKTSSGVWLCASAPSDRAAVSLRRETRDGASALRNPAAAAAAGRLPPGSLHSRLSPPRARPSPPPGRAAEAPAPASALRSGSAPARPPALAQSLPPRAPPRVPPARRNPRRGRGRGCLGGYPKARGESGKTGGVRVPNSGRRRSEGGGRRAGSWGAGTAATEPSLGGSGRRGRGSWAKSFLTGKIDSSGGRFFLPGNIKAGFQFQGDRP